MEVRSWFSLSVARLIPDVLEDRQEVLAKLQRVFAHRKVTEVFHDVHLCAAVAIQPLCLGQALLSKFRVIPSSCMMGYRMFVSASA